MTLLNFRDFTITASQIDPAHSDDSLLVALERSNQTQKFAFLCKSASRVRARTIEARDIVTFEKEVDRAKERFGHSNEAPVEICYDAGRDGFWIQRVIPWLGWNRFVIESSSFEVDRRSEHRKTDRIDAEKMAYAVIRSPPIVNCRMTQ